LDEEEALSHVGHGDDAGGEVGVIGPRSAEGRGVALRIQVEVGDLLELAVLHVVGVEDAQARRVVRLVHVALVGVHVVVDGRGGADVGADQGHVVQVLDVEDVGPGVDGALVELIAEQDVFVVLGQPALVSIGRARVACGTDQGGVRRIGDVDDGEGVLVETEGDFLAGELRVRADVRDDLGVVGVPVCGKGAEGRRVGRVADVHDVQSAGEGVGAHPVGPTDFGVDDDVVCVAEPGVDRVGLEGHRGVGDAAELGQIDDLHAVAAGLGDDEGVVGVDLDVPPQGARRFGGHVGHEERVEGVGNVDEGGPVRPAHDHVLRAVDRVHPAPDVVGFSAAQLVERHEGHQVDVLAGELARHPVLTGDLAVRDGGGQQKQGEKEALDHAAKVPLHPPRCSLSHLRGWRG